LEEDKNLDSFFSNNSKIIFPLLPSIHDLEWQLNIDFRTSQHLNWGYLEDLKKNKKMCKEKVIENAK